MRAPVQCLRLILKGSNFEGGGGGGEGAVEEVVLGVELMELVVVDRELVVLKVVLVVLTLELAVLNMMLVVSTMELEVVPASIVDG